MVDNSPPRELSPLRVGTWTYDVVDTQGKKSTATQTVTHDPSDSASPWRRAISADHIIAHLCRQPDGSIVMGANEILDHHVINAFDPPQVVLPAPEALNSTVTMTSKVITTLTSGPKIQVDHGTAELTLTPGGTETLTTPAGTFKCWIVQLHLHLKFGLGEVTSSARLDYADKVGLVAETYDEKATSFFLSSIKSRRSELRDYPR